MEKFKRWKVARREGASRHQTVPLKRAKMVTFMSCVFVTVEEEGEEGRDVEVTRVTGNMRKALGGHRPSL